MDFLLGLGIGTDTETDDRLDLTSAPYTVLADSFRVEEDAADARYVYVTFGMHLRGASHNALLNAHNAIIEKLNQATLGGTAVQDWVTLGVKLSAADEMVWWHVVSGWISNAGSLRPYGNYIGHMSDPLALTLRCHRGAFGEPIDDEPALITGADPVLFREGVPGTLPAYVEAVITDTSENSVVLHGIGVGSRSAKDMADGDFEPFQDLDAGPAGSLEENESDAFGSNCIVSSPGFTWATIAYTNPTEAQMVGRYDLWLRVRDQTPILDTPEGLALTPVAGASMRQSSQTTGRNGVTSLTIDDYTGTLAGNTLFLDVYAWDNATTPSVSSVPSGFTLVESDTQSNMLVASYIYPDAPAMSADLVVGFTNTDEALIRFEEWNGLTDSPTDVTTDNSVASSTSHPTGTTGTTANANSVARTNHVFVRSGGAIPTAYTDGYVTTIGGTGLGTNARAYAAYRVLTSTGTQSATLTTSVATASANIIATYTADAGGALSAATYHYRVAALDTDGALSRASTTAAVYHPNANAATQVEWQASLSPAVTGYRVYVRQGTGTWVYFNTPDTTPAFTHVTMSGPDGTADPPDTGVDAAEVRLGFALGDNGRVLHTTPTMRARRGNGIWEWLRFNVSDLPMVARPPGITSPDYRITVETRNGDGDLSVDVLAFIPGDEAYFAANADYALESVQEWVMGTNPGGHRFAWIRDPNDSTDVSGAISEGTFAIGPGDTTLLFLLYGPDGQSVVDDAGATVTLTLYPRWHWLAGSL